MAPPARTFSCSQVVAGASLACPAAGAAGDATVGAGPAGNASADATAAGDATAEDETMVPAPDAVKAEGPNGVPLLQPASAHLR